MGLVHTNRIVVPNKQHLRDTVKKISWQLLKICMHVFTIFTKKSAKDSQVVTDYYQMADSMEQFLQNSVHPSYKYRHPLALSFNGQNAKFKTADLTS